MVDNIAITLQHESNQRRIRSFIKQNDLLADAQIDDAAIIGQLPDVAIYHEFSSDTYKIRYKETREFMSEDEISVWLKKIENPPIGESVKSDHKIKALNFNNPLNHNGRSITDLSKLWEIDKQTKVNLINQYTQEFYKFDWSDEASIIDKLTHITAQYEAIHIALSTNKIKVLDREKKERIEKHEREKENRANGLQKSGKIKIKKTAKAVESTKFDIKRDPLYSKYAGERIMLAFFQMRRKPLNDEETMTAWKKTPMYLDSIS